MVVTYFGVIKSGSCVFLSLSFSKLKEILIPGFSEIHTVVTVEMYYVCELWFMAVFSWFWVDLYADTWAEESRSDQNILGLVDTGPHNGKLQKRVLFAWGLNRVRLAKWHIMIIATNYI